MKQSSLKLERTSTATPGLSGSPHLAPLVVTTVSVQTRVLDSSPVRNSSSPGAPDSGILSKVESASRSLEYKSDGGLENVFGALVSPSRERTD